MVQHDKEKASKQDEEQEMAGAEITYLPLLKQTKFINDFS